MKQIVLASASARRSTILAGCGIAHNIIPSHVKEIRQARKGIRYIVVRNATQKATAVAGKLQEAIVIGVDTLVQCGRRIIGKPRSREEARRMLRVMRGRTIAVYTGVCVCDGGRERRVAGYEKTMVTVAPLTDREIRRFFTLLGPYDKAGGFSIEGAGSFIFDDIKGSYFNVLGLPMRLLRELCAQLNIDILERVTPSR